MGIRRSAASSGAAVAFESSGLPSKVRIAPVSCRAGCGSGPRRLCFVSRKQATLEVDEELLSALQRAAAEDGVAPGELLDEALRRYFGLRGLAVLNDLGARESMLTEDEAMELAVGEIRVARAERRAAS